MSSLLNKVEATSWPPTLRAAIRAVIDRHKDDGYGYCYECSAPSSLMPFPCSTLEDIAEALDEGEIKQYDAKWKERQREKGA